MKRTGKIMMMTLTAVCVAVVCSGCKSSDYKEATAMLEEGKYAEASAVFTELADYKDSADKLTQSNYALAGEKKEQGLYEEAEALYAALGEYEDSAEQVSFCRYQQAEELFTAGDYAGAQEIYEGLTDYQQSADRAAECSRQIMLDNYAEVLDKLNGKTYYFEDTAVNVINAITFTGRDKVMSEDSYVDGNGWHDSDGTEDTITAIDDSSITLSSNVTIGYTLTDGEVVLEEKFVSKEQVEEELNGCWKIYQVQYILGRFTKDEYNIRFDHGKCECESGALSYDGSSYYYYGPYTGNYTVGVGQITTDAEADNLEYGFLIKDGHVVVCHYSHEGVRSDSLPGEDGYYHLFE